MSAPSQNLGVYALMFFSVNGNIVMQEVSISVENRSNAQRVFTVPLGAAGESLGAADCEFTMESAIPISGIEVVGGVALDQACVNLQVLEFNVSVGLQNQTFNGFIESVSKSHEAQAKSKVTYKGWGTFTTLQ